MSLKIKELYQSDLDPNNNDWWSNDKIDKINYNFNLLSNGGAAGPFGNKGVDGDAGSGGIIGPRGYRGDVGPQGFQGVAGLGFWERGVNDEIKSLFPKFQSQFEYEAVRTGIGHLENEQVAFTFGTRLLEIHNHTENFNSFSSNIILRADNSLNFHIKLSQISKNNLTTKIMEFGKLDAVPFNLFIHYDVSNYTYILKTSPEHESLSINKSNLISNVKTNKFGINDETTIINGNLKYNKDVSQGDILTSLDINGDVIWVNNNNLFQNFPIGSIISITPEFFNTNNFEIEFNQSITNINNKLKNVYGRGKKTGPFAGWYLCHGEIWGNGITNYNIPNLNSFTYEIDSNGGLQDAVIGGDDSQILIGGANIRLQATYDFNNSTYNILFKEPLDQSIDEITLDDGTADLTVSKNIHIVYLGNVDLFWNEGNQPASPSITEIELARDSDWEDVCEGTRSTYKWTGNGRNWKSDSMLGVSLYNEDLSRAPSTWYAREGIVRYWDGKNNEFTRIRTCRSTNSINLVYNLDVTQLNGRSFNTNIDRYDIDTNDFNNALLLLLNGTNATAGWYRDTSDDRARNRRYWDGNNFRGETIINDYVFFAGELGLSTLANSIACNANTLENVYYETSDPSPSGITKIHEIANSNGKILVDLDWQGNADGRNALIYVEEQNSRTQNIKYLSMVASGYRAYINNSRIFVNDINICE